MAPKIRIKAKQVKKRTHKKKSKAKGRKKVAFKVSQEIQDKCKDWILDQKRIPKVEFEQSFMEELPSDDEEKEDQDEEPENPADYEIPFRQLPKLNQEGPSKDSAKMMLECEWNGCNRDFIEVKDYFGHISEHIGELDNEEESEGMILKLHVSIEFSNILYCLLDSLICKWSLCQYESSDAKSLRRHFLFHAYHTRIKTDGANLCNSVKLPVCKMSSQHRNVIPESTTDYFCYWADCRESFVSIQNYFDHVALHILLAYSSSPTKVNSDVACKWYNCDKKYKQKIHMQAHVIKHTGEKSIACYNCGASFVTKYKMFDHLRRQMEGEYECSQCFRCFPIEKYLLIHMKAHVNYFKCTLCDMSCASQSQLAKHIRYRHIKERPFQCKDCPFKAVTKRDLDIHANTHDKDFVIKCPVVNCEYTCRVITALKKHDELEHGQIPKIYKCHICDKTFNYGKRLSKHLMSQHEYQYPPGHLRFTYKQDEDGFFKFQTMRLESLEVSKQIMQQDHEQEKEAVPSQGQSDTTSPIKRIEDFDVMKKYLKPKKSTNITIEVTDTDAKGRKIKSKTFQVEEFVVS